MDRNTPNRRAYLSAVATLGCVAVAGCTDGGGGGTGTTETTTTEPTSTPTVGARVTMEGREFSPVRAEIAPGEAVEWTNEDGFEHDVTARQFHDSAASWDFAQSVPADGSITRAFPEAGVYEYVCTIHGESTMCGAVLVGDASLDATLPCESDGSGSGGDGGSGGSGDGYGSGGDGGGTY